MAFGRAVVITGLKPLLSKLAGLRSTEAKAVRRRALMEASKPVLQAAKSLVNLETGLLRRSLGRRVRTYRSGSTIVVIIGPRSGFKQEVKRKRGFVLANPTKYAHLTEFGTYRFPGTHWLERAEESTREQVLSKLKESISAAVEREFSR